MLMMCVARPHTIQRSHMLFFQFHAFGPQLVILCVCAFVHLRVLFVLHNILIGSVADSSELKCLMRSCAAAVVVAAVAKRQTYEHTHIAS